MITTTTIPATAPPERPLEVSTFAADESSAVGVVDGPGNDGLGEDPAACTGDNAGLAEGTDGTLLGAADKLDEPEEDKELELEGGALEELEFKLLDESEDSVGGAEEGVG